MKVFQVPMLAMSLVGLGLLCGLDAPPARADFTFGAPTDLDVARLFFPNSNVFVTSFSSDYREMFVYSDLGGGVDIWVLKRAAPEDDWGPPENLGPTVNTADGAAFASITGDGLELYFGSFGPGGYPNWDIYVATRATRTSPWASATNLGSKVNSSYVDVTPSVSSDGLELYFTSTRPGGYGGGDLHVSKRATPNDPWGAPVNLGPVVNSAYGDDTPNLSPDGLLLLFEGDRPGGYGKTDLWMTRRASHTAPWGPVVNLGPIINSSEIDCQACLAPDGSALYFAWNWYDRPDRPWKAPILPIVDFNADKKVDLTDLVMLIENWGTNKTLYDIGPFAWGDGKVDIEDLKVFMAEWEKQNPPTQP